MTALRSHQKAIRGLTVVIATCALASAVYGAEQRLEEIIVSGVKDPRHGSLIRSSASKILSPGDVVGPIISVGEMVGRLPGAASNGQGGVFQSYSLRGFSRSRIRTEISGVPIISDRRAGNSLSFIPELFIETIRADMGPASSLYGSGAMGGVLSLSLREPEQTALNLSLGSAGSHRGLGLETRISDETAISASFKVADASQASNNQLLNTGFRQSAVYMRNTQMLGDLLINSEFIAGFGSDLGKSSAFFPSERRSIYPHDEHMIVNLRATNESGWFAQVYVHDQDWASRTERYGSRQNTSRYQSQTYGALLSHRQSNEVSQNRWGIELNARTNVDITEIEKPLAGNATLVGLVDDGSERVSGAFADRLWFINDTTLRMGARIDRAHVGNGGTSRSKTKANGQVQIETTLPNDWLIAAELGTAYRLPTLNELYFSGETPRGIVRGNPLLVPEETIGSQITLSTQRSDLLFEISGFYNRVDHYIERTRAGDESLTYQNLRSGEVWGFDGILSFPSDDTVEHRIQWQWQRGRADTGEFLDDLPPSTVSYTGTWRQDSLTVAVDLAYRFSREDRGPGELPLGSAVIAAARIEWDINPQWTSSINLSNGLDRAYRTSADEDAPLANERAVHVTLRWTP